MKLWEHKIIYLEAEATQIQASSYANVEIDLTTLYEDTLDSFGSEGWELVSVMAHSHPRYPDKHVPTAWFKRQVVRDTDAPEPALTPEERVRTYMEEGTLPTSE